jgi:IS605 OrfB family transposase
MKLTLQLQLLPTPEQKADLLAVMEHFNEAASFVANIGFEAKVYGQVTLHKLCYHEIRARFGLSSQMAVRAIAKAVEAFQRDKSKCPVFKLRGAITYDQRVLSFKGLTIVSLWVLTGRILIPFVCGEYQKERQGRIKGQADLVSRQGKFYLLCTIEMPETTPLEPKDVLGVDLGIVNIATDSEGETFSGAKTEEVRQRYHQRRKTLNRVGTKSARRRLSQIRKREANFRRNENHRIANRIVAKAKATGSALAFEDLKGMRDRVSVQKPQRARHAGWAFFQLRAFVEYKAKLAGVTVVFVDPRNTSRTCAECGHCEKANRKSQAAFECRHCGHSANADGNAARNIAFRARGCVKVPMVGSVEAKAGLRNCG